MLTKQPAFYSVIIMFFPLPVFTKPCASSIAAFIIYTAFGCHLASTIALL